MDTKIQSNALRNAQQAAELRCRIDDILSRWCPAFSIKHEIFEQQVIRALLHFGAYELDVQRVMRGEQPIRTDYPLPLPKI